MMCRRRTQDRPHLGPALPPPDDGRREASQLGPLPHLGRSLDANDLVLEEPGALRDQGHRGPRDHPRGGRRIIHAHYTGLGRSPRAAQNDEETSGDGPAKQGVAERSVNRPVRITTLETWSRLTSLRNSMDWSSPRSAVTDCPASSSRNCSPWGSPRSTRGPTTPRPAGRSSAFTRP